MVNIQRRDAPADDMPAKLDDGALYFGKLGQSAVVRVRSWAKREAKVIS